MKNRTFFLIGFTLWSCQSNLVTNPGVSDKSDEPAAEVLTRNSDSGLNAKTSVIAVDTLSSGRCEKTLVTTIENFKVWKLNKFPVIAFQAKFAIDADGSPRAYCPENNGLDYTANGGKPGNWWGVVTDNSGNPVIQKSGDPCPGCYISPTTLSDKTLPKDNPLKYVNSELIPFIVLPSGVINPGKIRIGDFAYAYNIKNGKSCFAIFADAGPGDKLGEGSIFLAERLGINSNPKNGGLSGGIIYIIFAGSGKGNGYLMTIDEINSIGKAELDKIGGPQLVNCFR
jgi:hypothetical protein